MLSITKLLYSVYWRARADEAKSECTSKPQIPHSISELNNSSTSEKVIIDVLDVF